MKQVRDVNACIAQLRALQRKNDTKPEQTKYIDEAIEELRKLRRKSNPTKAEVFRCVRKVAENLLHAFDK